LDGEAPLAVDGANAAIHDHELKFVVEILER
jgi:hypothetical protein